MKPIWTLRQLLAWLRGLTIMVALFWALVLIQIVPALVTGGFSGLRGQFVRVATAGVPPEEQNIAVEKCTKRWAPSPSLASFFTRRNAT